MIWFWYTAYRLLGAFDDRVTRSRSRWVCETMEDIWWGHVWRRPT